MIAEILNLQSKYRPTNDVGLNDASARVTETTVGEKMRRVFETLAKPSKSRVVDAKAPETHYRLKGWPQSSSLGRVLGPTASSVRNIDSRVFHFGLFFTIFASTPKTWHFVSAKTPLILAVLRSRERCIFSGHIMKRASLGSYGMTTVLWLKKGDVRCPMSAPSCSISLL